MPEKLQFSSIVERSLTILGRNLTGAALLSVLLVGLPGAFLATQLPMPGQESVNMLGFITGLLVLTVGQTLLIGSVLYAVFRHLIGLPPAGIGLLLSYGTQIALPSVVVALAVGLITGLGFLFFIVPGLIFSLVFFVAVPAAIIERLSVGEALRRSIELTQGHRWSLFAYLVIVWIASLLIGWFVSIVFHLVGLADVASVIVSSLISAFTAIVTSVVYHDLRHMQEGATAKNMVDALK